MAHEYLFDVKLFASIRVVADTEAEARAWLREHLDCADANFGSDEGAPIVAEASMDGEADLIEVDGEDPDADLAEAAGDEVCHGCGRPSLDCSRDPCPDVIADREA